jgi:hypothetical protein
MKSARRVIAASLLVAAWGCVAEEQSSFVPPDGAFEGALYTGELAETDAMVAFAVRDDNVVGYVCGGDTTIATHSRWFCDRAERREDGLLHIVKTEAAWTLDALIGATSVQGTVRSPDGVVYDVNAPLAADGAGLFADEVGGCSTGVIVLPAIDGAENRAQGAHCADGFEQFEQVTPVRPLERDLHHLDVVVGTDGPQMTVFRVQP